MVHPKVLPMPTVSVLAQQTAPLGMFEVEQRIRVMGMPHFRKRRKIKFVERNAGSIGNAFPGAPIDVGWKYQSERSRADSGFSRRFPQNFDQSDGICFLEPGEFARRRLNAVVQRRVRPDGGSDQTVLLRISDDEYGCGGIPGNGAVPQVSAVRHEHFVRGDQQHGFFLASFQPLVRKEEEEIDGGAVQLRDSPSFSRFHAPFSPNARERIVEVREQRVE
jgi:hypothetical protein